jgi:hypothetical protein
MIVKNSIFFSVATKRTLRAIDVVGADQIGEDDAVDYLVMIDLDAGSNRMPEAIRYPAFLEQLGAKEWLSRIDTQISIDLSKLSPAETQALNRRWEVLQLALKEGPHLYVPSLRNEIARRFADEKIATRPFLYSTLRSFWRNGMVKQALVPAFRLCGAPDVARVARDSSQKLGCIPASRRIARCPQNDLPVWQ